MNFLPFSHACNTITNINDKLTFEQRLLRTELINQMIQSRENVINYQKKYEQLLSSEVLQISKDNKIHVLYPFSGTPTNKKIFYKKRKEPLYAMCAIDAIGIYFTIHTDIKIYSECQLTKAPIVIEMTNGKTLCTSGQNDVRVLHTDLTNATNWATCCCSQMHFFNNDAYLNKWVQHNGCAQRTYYNLSLTEATIIAKKLFLPV